MNWARDNTGLNERDLDHVFKYEEKPTTVEPIVWSLMGRDEWDEWLQSVISTHSGLMRHSRTYMLNVFLQECPTIHDSAPGLVLILAKRTGEPTFGTTKKVGSNDWLDRILTQLPLRSRPRRALTFESLAEKQRVPGSAPGATASGQRSVRTLPFTKDTFRSITKHFYTHSSIGPVISRADIPVFSSAEVRMGEQDDLTHSTQVYNCRTSNAWEMDLALTTTYFSHRGLTFAILFGCPLSVEEEILKRLSYAMAEASHPLLLPGIFAELERSRHVNIVESTIDEIETRIMELDFNSSNMDEMPDTETERRNQEKRSAWLDTTYLRNGLISWNTQLIKVREQVDQLNDTVFRSQSLGDPVLISQSKAESRPSDNHRRTAEPWETVEDHSRPEQVTRHLDEPQQGPIQDRIQAIIDEYDDKVRDCTMRVDGMAMATQWAQGETNVGIALATNRDSKHMRSIALVTMIFLPGTFFASVFSMTFFDWSGPSGATISGYFWIYVVFTVFFTLLTIGTWWFFVIYRPSRHHTKTLEEDRIPLV
ncbi:hypothetical protein BJ170DRAFT_683378 [Xylariales sp. AK1849]|nr:hypothetical protein BJ170DRAFT_683378 [Xylariales sp. AK1849]